MAGRGVDGPRDGAFALITSAEGPRHIPEQRAGRLERIPARHVYVGNCPTPENPTWRDSECSACRHIEALDRLRAARQRMDAADLIGAHGDYHAAQREYAAAWNDLRGLA